MAYGYQQNGPSGQQPPEEEEQKKSRSDGCSGDCVPNCDLPCGCDLLIAPLLLLPPTGLSGLSSRRSAAGATSSPGTPGAPERPALPRPLPRPSVPARAGAAAIRGYQRWLSQHLPTRCRMAPTCSEYGRQAVRRYGLAAGARLAAARIQRCGTTHGHGVPDLVP